MLSPVEIWAGGTFEDNCFYSGDRPCVRVVGGANATFRGNLFVDESDRFGVLVTGAGAHAEFIGNTFMYKGGGWISACGLLVAEGARALLSENAFLYDASADLSDYRWPGARIAGGAVEPVDETPAERAAHDAKLPFGLVVGGAGSSAHYEGNLFLTRRGGVAVHVMKGGAATEGADNEFVGADSRRSSGD